MDCLIRFCGTGIILFFFFALGKSQSKEKELPALYPTAIEHLENNNFIPNYCVRSFVKDTDGRLWLSTCDIASSAFKVYFGMHDGYRFESIDLTLPNNNLRTNNLQLSGFDEQIGLYGITYDRLGENSALFIYDTHKRLASFPQLPEAHPISVVADKKGNCWIAAFLDESHEIAFYRWDGNRISLEAKQLLPTSLPEDFGLFLEPGDLLLTGEDLYFTHSSVPLIHFNTSTKQLRTLEQLKPAHINQLKLYRSHQFAASFLIAETNGFYLVNLSREKALWHYDPIKKQIETIDLLDFSPAQAFLEQDKEGNILFVFRKHESNLFEARLLDKSGQWYDYTPMLANLPFIYSLQGENFFEGLTLATQDGMFIVRRTEQQAIRHISDDFSIRRIAVEGKDAAFVYISKQTPFRLVPSTNSIETIEQHTARAAGFRNTIKYCKKDAKGRAWYIWAEEDELLFIPVKKEDAELAFTVNESLKYFDFLPDGRLIGISEEVGHYILYQKAPYDANLDTLRVDGKAVKLPLLSQLSSFVSKDGSFWISTHGGMYRVLPKQQGIKKYPNELFPDYRVFTFHECNNGEIWMGTVKSGVQVFDPKKEQIVRQINTENGLSNDVVVSILEDDDGDFWIGTFNGLNILSPNGVVKNRLYQKDGLSNNEFNRYAYDKLPSGQLLFGTIKGLNIIDPKLLKATRDKKSTQIYLTSLAYFDQDLEKEINFSNWDASEEPFHLAADHRYLKVDVAMSNYCCIEGNNFAYRLEGKDKEWNFLGKQHQIRLPNLPSGKYSLLIKGIDDRGNDTINTLAFPLIVHDHFYNQYWFYGLCFGLLGIIAFYWINYLRGEQKRLNFEVVKRTQQIEHDKALIEQQAQELIHADELKSRFFTNISHELRTPITLIAAPLENLIKKYSSHLDENIQHIHQTVFRNAKKLRTLVEELLEISRLDAGQQSLILTPTQIHGFCRQLFSAFYSEADRKQIQYRFKNELEEDLNLMIDQKRLVKILDNLLGNAIKFTPPNGTIEMSLKSIPNPPNNKKEAKWLEIRVEDSGKGIAEEDLPYIFDRYFQTKRKDRLIQNGTGIGLSLAKELAHLMKGSLEVESTWGKGSTFILQFPALITEVSLLKETAFETPTKSTTPLTTPAQSKTDQLNSKANSQNKKHKILIVEDNLDMQDLIISLLEPHYHCQVANNGQEALSLLANPKYKNIHLIISDIMMPIMDGYELLTQLKNDSHWQQVPIIMLTARATEDAKLKALKLGVDDYLIKPFSPDELKVRVQNLLQNFLQKEAYKSTLNAEQKLEFDEQLSENQQWLDTLKAAALEALEKQIKLNASFLADRVALSDRQLLRRLKSLTGLSVKKYIVEIKLQKARHLLENKTFQTVAEISYASGFRSASHFTKAFQTRFGKRPSEYFEALA